MIALIQAAAPTVSPVPLFVTIGAPVLSMLATIVSWVLLSRKATREHAASEAMRTAEFKRLDQDVRELKTSHAAQDGEMRSQLRQLLDLVQGMKIDIARLQERDSLAKELAAIRGDRRRGTTEA